MSRSGKKESAADLLNFRSSYSPQQAHHSSSIPRNRGAGGRSNHQGRHGNSGNPPKRKPPPSLKRVANPHLFALHSSADHAFVLSRRPPRHANYSFQGSDQPVSWESVRIVKSLVPSEVSCPICLDSFTCTRITKCGHMFCLPCLLHHVHAFALNHPYDTDGAKCPCCAVPLHLTDIRPVVLVSVLPPQVGQSMTFVKLHRKKSGCSTPYLPLPTHPRRSAPQAAPSQVDGDAPYCRFNYVDPQAYQSLLETNLAEVQSMTLYSDVERLCQTLALERVHKELNDALLEQDDEVNLMNRFASPQAGIYQTHGSHLFAVDGTSSPRQNQTVSEPSSERRSRGDSITSVETTDSSRSGAHCRRGFMFLDDDETAFYQAEDGSLCFLSGFNMNCFRSEFCLSQSDREECSKSSIVPLPDVVEGKVIEIEKVSLTEDMQHRLRFLSHLPTHSSIVFVELNIGRLLSKETKDKFKKEFAKRKKTRELKKNAERREDERERRKELAVIDERKSRYQRIDPEDEFFRPVPQDEIPLEGDAFGPCLGTSDTPHSTSQGLSRVAQDPDHQAPSFSAVARLADQFPALRTEDNFPSLGSSPPSRKSIPNPAPWGIQRMAASRVHVPVDKGDQPIRGASKKKVVLLSTNTHRGSYR